MKMNGHVSQRIIMDSRYIFLVWERGSCASIWYINANNEYNCHLFVISFTKKLLHERRPNVLPTVADVLIEFSFIQLLMNAHKKTRQNNGKRSIFR